MYNFNFTIIDQVIINNNGLVGVVMLKNMKLSQISETKVLYKIDFFIQKARSKRNAVTGFCIKCDT